MNIVTVTHKATFSRPAIGPRDYVSVNAASGWPESFGRHESDHRLQSFLGEGLTVPELLDNFGEFVELKHGGRCSWMDVIGYLGRITKTDPDDISYQVAIAFWGQMVLRERAAETAKKGTKKCLAK